MKEARKSIWVQIFLANKYLNEFFKNGILAEYDLKPNDYFFLVHMRIYENFTFYEYNKHMPMDGKSLHNKIKFFIERGLMSREYDEAGTSVLNLTDKARKIINDVYITSLDDTESYFEEGELLGLHSSLYEFNEKMRKILELELSESSTGKINLELL